MKTICDIYKKHPILFMICVVVSLLCVMPLTPLGYESIIGFKKEVINWNNYISNLHSLVVTATIALLVYLFVDKQTSDKIDEIKKTETNIQQNTERTNKINEEMQNNVKKMYFQIERSAALNQYPDRQEFKNINRRYQPFIFSLFSDIKPNISIIISPNNQKELAYNIEVIKNEANIPILKKTTAGNFYITKIISPTYLEGTTEEQLDEYKYSPIKEGEYYGCRFDTHKYSWIIGKRLEQGKEYEEEFYQFYVTGSVSGFTVTRSANEAMGYNENSYPNHQYNPIDQFTIDQPQHSQGIIRLFRKERYFFLTIGDSPLKQIYILKKFTNKTTETFLVFEHLRGVLDPQKMATS